MNLVLDKYFGFSLLKEEMLKTIFLVIVFVTIYCYKQKQRYSVNETSFSFLKKKDIETWFKIIPVCVCEGPIQTSQITVLNKNPDFSHCLLGCLNIIEM